MQVYLHFIPTVIGIYYNLLCYKRRQKGPFWDSIL